LIRFLPPASVLPSLLAGTVWAADFEFQPALSAAQYYTDNVNLAPRGLEQGDWVTIATPALTFRYNGAKLKFFASIAADVIYRNNDSSLDVEPRYSGGTLGSMEIVPQSLYLDTNSNVRQQSASVLSPQALNNVNTTDNRTTVHTTLISPYYRHTFGSQAITELRYSYTIVNTDEATGGSGGSAAAARGGDSTGDRFDVSLVSGPAYKRTTWNLRYYWDHVDYDRARDTTRESISAGLRYLVTPFVGLLAQAGYEDNDFISTTTTPKGSFWSLGFDWNPSPRTHFAVTSGRRYYGPSHTLAFDHRTRLTVWNVRYTETVTTYRQEVLVPVEVSTAAQLDTVFLSRFPDPIARQQAVNDFIAASGLPPTLIAPVSFFTNQFYLNKTWSASAGLQGPRHTFLVNAFETTRETQSVGLPADAGDFAGTSTVKQTGAGVVWSWRITPVGSSTMSLGYNRSETPGLAREDERRYLRATYVHQFTPKMSGSLNYHRLENESTSASGSYLENQVSALLQMKF
jgi:uncharacterized protein (PEP-CTERM system associated)